MDANRLPKSEKLLVFKAALQVCCDSPVQPEVLAAFPVSPRVTKAMGLPGQLTDRPGAKQVC
jgi:hypothetical protein